MRKILSIIAMVLVSALLVTACGQKPDENNAADSNSADKTWKACFVTSTPRGNEFTDLIWSGLVRLEEEGWEIKCIETFEQAEQAEQIRAMCSDGYDIIYTLGDDVMATCKEMANDINDLFPSAHFVFLDTYEKTEFPNTCAVTIDPFEACFIAGFVAANKTESGDIGLMLPLDNPIMRRFEYGYKAGVDYANTGAQVIKAYTNDWSDTTKGYESTMALVQNYPDIDVLIQAAYISGYGVIQACADMQLPCIGVDDWQGDIDPVVFWSAVKSMDVAVYKTAHMIFDCETLPFALEFDLASGGLAYIDVDLDNLTPELAAAVVQLKDDIIAGKVDVFAGEYEEWRETNFDQ